MQHTCGNEMRDMGQWPNKDQTALVNKYHCITCNEYVDVDVPGYKLQQEADGTLKQVPCQ